MRKEKTVLSFETYFWKICLEGGIFLLIAFLFIDIQKGFLENRFLFIEHLKRESEKKEN